MAPVKYETKDVMPIALIVLNYIPCDICSSMFKMALDNQFSDLKGLVDPEEMDQEMCDLTATLDDPLSLLLMEFMDEVMALYTSLALIHGIDLIELFTDERLKDLAEDFYDSRSYYCYGLSDDNRRDMELYFFSLPLLIAHLKELFENGEVDTDPLPNWDYLQPEYFEQFEYTTLPVVRSLGDLALSVFNYYDRLSAVPDQHHN